MRALSVRQPWAGWIASGRKAIEVRAWATSFRGELLIVSSRRPPIHPAGCALAVVRLSHCRPVTAGDEEAACCSLSAGSWAWVLTNPRRIRPFPVRGRLGLYEVELPEAGLVFETGEGGSRIASPADLGGIRAEDSVSRGAQGERIL